MSDEENLQSEPEPATTEVLVQQTVSGPAGTPPEATEAPASSSDPVTVKDQNTAPPSQDATAGQGNEPLEQPAQTVQTVMGPEQTEPNTEQNPTPETPENSPEPSTAQMVANEPLERRHENLNKANLTRQNKKRKKIDNILNLFIKNPKITNNEIEKLLHVSDATATRYLETLEKEGKIKQVGKTGKYTHYEKI